MEKWHATFKNLVATKNSPWTPRFGSPSIQFMIIFTKIIFSFASLSINIIFQLFSSLTILGKFTLLHLLFIIMYILVYYIDLGYEQSCIWRV